MLSLSVNSVEISMNVIRALENKNLNFTINTTQLSEYIGKFDYNKDIVNLFRYFVHDINSMTAVNIITQMPNIESNNSNLTRLNLYKSNLELSKRGSFMGRHILSNIRNRLSKDELKKSAMSLSSSQLIQIKPPRFLTRDADTAATPATASNANRSSIHNQDREITSASTCKLRESKFSPMLDAVSDDQMVHSFQNSKLEKMSINRGSVSQRINAYNNMLISQHKKTSQSSQFNDWILKKKKNFILKSNNIKQLWINQLVAVLFHYSLFFF
jgi:hypothetical protein